MGLFGKEPKKSPIDKVREWNSKLNKQSMLLDREIRGIRARENKTKIALKEAAKKGNRESCVVLAREIVRARKAVARIYTSKAQINSVILSMKQQIATARVTGALSKSTDVMKCMQGLIKMSEISQVMQELSKEMMKAGILDEMMQETLDEVTGMDDLELEEQAQSEIDKVLYELTAGQLGSAPDAVSTAIRDKNDDQLEKNIEEDEEEISEMRKRLEKLRS